MMEIDLQNYEASVLAFETRAKGKKGTVLRNIEEYVALYGTGPMAFWLRNAAKSIEDKDIEVTDLSNDKVIS